MALITGFGLFLVSVLIAALSRTVAEEIDAWTPSVIRSFIKLAVRRLPESERERFDEEWQSHVSEVPGKVGKLLVATGFLMAAYKIALNWPPPLHSRRDPYSRSRPGNFHFEPSSER